MKIEITFKRFYMKWNNEKMELKINIMGKIFYLTIENKMQGLNALFGGD